MHALYDYGFRSFTAIGIEANQTGTISIVCIDDNGTAYTGQIAI